jgi:hypothetical protein
MPARRRTIGSDPNLASTPATGVPIVLRVGGQIWRATPDRPWTIGRAAEGDVRLDDPGISRRHATLEPTPQGWILVNHGNNGVFVNGQRVERLAVQHPVTVSLGSQSAGVTMLLQPERASASDGAATQVAAARPAQPSQRWPANWYPDPAGSGRFRYFDGTDWTDHFSAPPAKQQQPGYPMRGQPKQSPAYGTPQQAPAGAPPPQWYGSPPASYAASPQPSYGAAQRPSTVRRAVGLGYVLAVTCFVGGVIAVLKSIQLGDYGLLFVGVSWPVIGALSTWGAVAARRRRTSHILFWASVAMLISVVVLAILIAFAHSNAWLLGKALLYSVVVPIVIIGSLLTPSSREFFRTRDGTTI